jgi:hypothetical protein
MSISVGDLAQVNKRTGTCIAIFILHGSGANRSCCWFSEIVRQVNDGNEGKYRTQNGGPGKPGRHPNFG